mgnify:CR=1 FL=1
MKALLHGIAEGNGRTLRNLLGLLIVIWFGRVFLNAHDIGSGMGPLLVTLPLSLELWLLHTPAKAFIVRVVSCVAFGVIGGLINGSGTVTAVVPGSLAVASSTRLRSRTDAPKLPS